METVTEALERYFKNSTDPIVFTGAGVSARAGVPTWGTLLTRLQEWLRSRDALTANQMAEYIHMQDFLTAADYFFLTKRVPDGEKFKILVDYLSDYESKALLPLIRLPFKGMVTTNFDRCLNDTYALAYGKTALDFRRGDVSFKQVQWSNQPFVARIHGGTEYAPSIILTSAHFQEVAQDDLYKDILVNLFTRKNVLFVGCSFTDPAVRAVFDIVHKQYGATPPGLHMALIPEGGDNDFITQLNRMNVEVVRYSPEDKHQALWDAIASCSGDKQPTQVNSKTSASPISPFTAVKRYLASCYARVRLSGRLHPLREAIVEGVVSSIVQSHSSKGIPEDSISNLVHRELGIDVESTSSLVQVALERLADEKLCRRHNDGEVKKVTWIGKTDDANTLDSAVDLLVKSAFNRAVVQEGLRPMQEVQDALKNFFKDLILQRGWDLGASYASNSVPEGVDIQKLLYQSCTFLSHKEIESLNRVCLALLSEPTEEEAKILTALGQASFALELVIQCPRNTLFHSNVLPQTIYLDANVLMPAITYGHPYFDIYTETINRLRKAASQSSGALRIVCYYGYLNEIVSHRRLAIDEVNKWGEDFRVGIVNQAVYYGTTNMNVFVGAYANLLQRQKDLEFAAFLQQYAPYTTEQELSEWLKKQGIQVQRNTEMKTSEFAAISLDLQKSYATAIAAGKDMQLIEHDAVQLSTLHRDRISGRRSILVTADKRLRDMVSKGQYKDISECMLSNVGLTQLINLLIGGDGDARGLSRLLWSAKASSKTEEVRHYLVMQALREYDEAMAMEMHQVVDKIAEDIVSEANRLGVITDSDDPNNRRKFLKFIGEFENKFFEAIREKIELRQKQSDTNK